MSHTRPLSMNNNTRSSSTATRGRGELFNVTPAHDTDDEEDKKYDDDDSMQ